MAVPAIRDQFDLVKRNSVSQLNERFVAIAKAANAAIMALPPRPMGFIRTVDGTVGLPEEAVRPNGLIVYNYQRLDIIVEFAIETLRELSPVLTGAYRDAHMLFLNNIAESPPYIISASDDVAISNLEPYARKIEIGKMKMTVPGTDHVYQQAQQIVQRTYGALVDVQFTWRSLSTNNNRARIVKKKKGRTEEHALQSQPTLVLRLK